MDGSTLRLAYLTLLGLTLFAQAVVASWVYSRHWGRDGATWFCFMVATGFGFVGSMFLFVLVSDPTLQYLFYVVSNFWGLVTVSCLVVFASTYTGSGLHRWRSVQATILAVVGGYAVLAVTNGGHHLLVAGYTPVAEPFPHLVVQRGPVHAGFVFALGAWAYYALYQMGTHLIGTRQRATKQVAMLVAGGISVGLFDLLSQHTTLMPVDGFSHAAFGAFFFYVLTALAIFRFSLLDVVPIARTTVVENLDDPMLILDDRGRIVDYNEASTDVWPGIDGAVDPQLESVCPALAAKVAITDGGASCDDDRVTLETDGRDRHYSVTVSEVSRQTGSEVGWYAVLLRDVTELEQSRWQLQTQNERLDQVASTVTHDLRSPLQVASGQLALMREYIDEADVDDESREKLRSAIGSTDRSTERMQSIIDDVLTMAREGKTVTETEPVDLGDVAREAWETVDPDDATLTVATDGRFRADRSKLLRIFENLFRNSLEHAGSGVTIEVGATDAGFYVADDGPGIPEADRDSVFEYGFTTADDGTGLGLSIVRTMAESHGWTVRLDDEHRSGTRFVFENVAVGDVEDQQGVFSV